MLKLNELQTIQEEGFSLLEILMVIMILLLLISLFGSSLKIWLARVDMEAELYKLYFTFLKARQLAITAQQEYGLKFDQQQNSYLLFSESETEIEQITFKPGIYISDLTSGFEQMTFKPLGTAEGGHITISNKYNSQYKIIVSGTTGRVRIEKVN